MAYQFADGFDNYGNSYSLTAGYPWDTISNAGTAVTSTADFRFTPPGSLPGGCVNITAANYIRKNLTGNPATVIVGFGIKLNVLPGSGQIDIADLWDSGSYQCSLCVNSNGALQFFRGSSGGTAIGVPTANSTFLAGQWYGLVFQVTIATGVGGSVQLYINGSATPAINSTGINTSSTGSAFATQVSIGPFSSSSAKYDDFYCIDTTGGFQNALLGGDARILTKMPSGAGNYTNWTPTGLGSNWQNVSQQPPNIADYNANNVATTKDSYAMQVASMGVAPYFVLARASLERDDAGTHNPSLFVRSGATDSGGVVTPTLTSSYLFYDALFQTDPSTTVAWTASGADNAQVGIIEG